MAGGWVISAVTKLMQSLPVMVGSSSWTPSSQKLKAEIESLREDLAYVQRTWRRIEAVLADAEQREVRDKSVRLWLWELRDLAYEADDLLDLYQYEVIAMEVRNREAPSVRTGLGKRKIMDDQVSVFNPSPSSPFDDSDFREELGKRATKFKNMYDEICNMKEDLQLMEYEDVRLDREIVERQPAGFLSEDSEIFGMELNLQELVSTLTSSNYSRIPAVVALVGMGGVGKTTLAQHAFNHSDVKNHFDIKGWVCVSDKFEVARLTKKVLEDFTDEVCHVTELDLLQKKLESQVRGKKFLLVMDDVWNENGSLWDKFLSCLRHGAEGSKILLTTRSEKISKTVQAAKTMKVGCLSEKDGWSLFEQCAFGSSPGKSQDYPWLTPTGKEIAKKCRGLPLALKVLGRRLSYDLEDPSAWHCVLESDLWDTSSREDGKEILGPLLLSYIHLPPHLKPCLKMCNVFEKDQRIDEHDLVSLWMAHDLIAVKDRDNWMDLEETGMRYINELASRSFLQHEKFLINLRMHDLIHDLVRFVSKDECNNDGGPRSLLLGNDSTLDWKHARPESLRALICRVDGFDCDYIQSSKHLRSLKLLLDGIDARNRISKLYNLRELALKFSVPLRVPDVFGNLKQLVKLELDRVHIDNLPESMFLLLKLKSLSIADWKAVGGFPLALPKGIVKLTSLQEIKISRNGDFYFPVGIGRLRELRKLGDYFQVGNCSSIQTGLAELRGLINLQGSLWIRGLRNQFPCEDTKEGCLINSEKLETLCLDWQTAAKNQGDDANESEHNVMRLDEEVLEDVRPHPNLRDLKIRGWRGSGVPSWLTEDPPYFTRLVHLAFTFCKSLKLLPLGRLPALESLCLLRCRNLEIIDFHVPVLLVQPLLDTSCRLKILYLRDCPLLRDVRFDAQIETALTLINCPLQFPPSLQRHEISRCPSLTLPRDCALSLCQHKGERWL